MNKIYTLISTLSFLFIFSINPLSAQEIEFSSARLTISHKEKTNNSKAEYIRLYDKEATDFDITAFLNANIDKDVWINGRFTSNGEIVEIKYNSKDVADIDDCGKICEQTLLVEKVPFLGVSTIGEQNFDGVLVETLVAGGTASELGLQQGDMITQLGSAEIGTSCDLTIAMNEIQIDDLIDITYVRKGKTKTKKANFGARVKKQVTFGYCCETEIAITELEATEQVSNDAVLNTNPNPTTGVSQIEFSAETNGNLTLTVTDLTGKELNRKEYNDFQGYHNEYIDLSDQPQGIYFINAVHADRTFVNKVVVQKP